MTDAGAPRLTLYDNPASPFARKVRIALEFKGIPHVAVNGLERQNHDALAAVNGRVEVPALVDRGVLGDVVDGDALVVVESADIVAYLDRAFPDTVRLLPEAPEAFARARAWERCADRVMDPIINDVALWTWADRDDARPEGMLEAARADLGRIYDALEHELRDRPFVCGDAVTVADVALFVELTSVRGLRVNFDAQRHPQVLAYFRRLRGMDAFAADVDRVKAYIRATMANGGANIERRRVFWRGERIEWLLARGFDRWFAGEIAADRVIWPGLDVPRPH